MEREYTRISKFISLVLRHKPEVVGARLDEHGWMGTEDLMRGIQKHKKAWKKFNHSDLKEVVKQDSKQRYILSDGGDRIRANQGHSLDINLQMDKVKPPSVLYHGTAKRNLKSIREEGLLRMNRQYVHLTTSKETAETVGKRYGEPALLEIDSDKMHKDGIAFYLSKNGVWLTNEVNVMYIKNLGN